jgi:hypothetical protein
MTLELCSKISLDSHHNTKESFPSTQFAAHHTITPLVHLTLFSYHQIITLEDAELLCILFCLPPKIVALGLFSSTIKLFHQIIEIFGDDISKLSHHKKFRYNPLILQIGPSPIAPSF